jgi:mannose-6-phosphate isomerase-like protein (cupin superfamily)
MSAVSPWIACALAGAAVAPLAAQNIITSAVVAEEDARNDKGDWGSITAYFEGTTAGTSDSLAATVRLKPDSEIHPPHRHAEEEYLFVTEGAGIWVLGDKKFPAKAGDMLYAAPDALHGIRSGKDSGLTFVIVKFAPRTPMMAGDPK